MEKIEQLVSSYKPNQATVDLIKKMKIILLAGITGAGKDAIKKELLKNPDFFNIVTCTTRQPRINGDCYEAHGIDYYFIDQSIAGGMLKEKQFVEAKLVHVDSLYGTPVSELQKAYDANKTAIIAIDVQGVDEYINISSDIKVIFILPPSHDVWRQRLENRYAIKSEFESIWPKRRASAINELTLALDRPYFNFVINDDLGLAVKCVEGYVNNKELLPNDNNEPRAIVLNILEDIKKA